MCHVISYMLLKKYSVSELLCVMLCVRIVFPKKKFGFNRDDLAAILKDTYTWMSHFVVMGFSQDESVRIVVYGAVCFTLQVSVALS